MKDCQIIFVVETNKQNESDYIYIRSVLKSWYCIMSRNDIKISKPVYMDGKGNYDKKTVCDAIEKKKKEYKNGSSHVIFCFDTDKYDSNQEALEEFKKEKCYCDNNGYDFVWFCHDVEEVFLGKSVAKNEKKEKAREYERNKGIENLDKKALEAKTPSTRRSNLVLILNKYIQ